MSQEEKKQTAPETEAAAEKPETPAQEAPEKEAPRPKESTRQARLQASPPRDRGPAGQAGGGGKEKRRPQEPAAPHRCRV